MAKRTQRSGTKRLSKRQQRARQRRWIVAGVVAILALATFGVAYAYLIRDEPGEEITDLGNTHLSVEPTSYIWNSTPPTSGPHSPQLAAWGEHDESIPEWYQVHNLEDGGVIMHYNCPDGCPEIVDELRAILDDKGTEQLVLHPYSTNMDSRIAVTAWTRLLTLDEMDRGQIEDFIDAYRGIDHHR